MEQKLIRFVKNQCFFLSVKFFELSFLSDPSSKNALAFGCKPMAWLFLSLWMFHAHLMYIVVIRSGLVVTRLMKYTTFGTFVLEAAILLVWNDVDLLELASWIIFLAVYALYAFYVICTLEKILSNLKKKHQEVAVINAIVCEGGGGAQSKQLSEQNHSLSVLYANWAIQELRRLSRRYVDLPRWE